MTILIDLDKIGGEYTPAPDLEGGPVPDEEALDNIRKSADLDIPIFTKRQRRDGKALYVGAGPSMPAHLEEIREKQKSGCVLITSNMTNDWLVDRGITPDFVMVIDPKLRVSDYIKKPQPTTEFCVATVCNPLVASKLLDKGAKVSKLLVAYGMPEEADIALQRDIYGENKGNFLVGGTMSGLRVMNFALLLGFGEIDVYGVDSCFGSESPAFIPETDGRFIEAVESNENAVYQDPADGKRYAILDPPDGGWFYAYKKKHHGQLVVARCPDGRKFWSSPVFTHQAKQFIKWRSRFEDKLKINVFGDNLTAHLIKCSDRAKVARKKLVGDKLWSEKYRPVFFDFFKNNPGHPVTYNYLDDVLKNGPSALSSSLGRSVEIYNYDKHVLDGVERVGKHDVVFTTNLLEHIEEECVDNVLDEIKRLTKYMAIINVQLGESDETLPDGEQAHITMKSGQWWTKKIGERFDIVESMWHGGINALYICQSLDAQENRKSE